ncbi:RNA polymerase sigma factor [Maribacter algarum]|uniref:RNA polymerase sigma factor n=1 Tax=Maribacter algarum (ex Zhang et al. 2020) TaxID=2578118 RepID=A0A5S3QLJ6_9FLAO|nr:RNA polymerase sigma factor [Maribacter algarum]TMM58754.1 RNA polymerase sigma factor [Maribacter algarum]
MTDEQLIAQLKKRDRNALKSVYLNYKTEFFKFMSRYNAKNDVLEDIFQDALIVLYENAQSGKLDALKSTVKTYLFGIGKFMLFKHFRDSKREVPTEETYLFDQYEQAVIEDVYEDEGPNDYQKQMAASFKKLGDKCREILELFYLQGMKLGEITVRQGYDNKDVAKSQKSRCLKSLKQLIGKKDG